MKIERDAMPVEIWINVGSALHQQAVRWHVEDLMIPQKRAAHK